MVAFLQENDKKFSLLSIDGKVRIVGIWVEVYKEKHHSDLEQSVISDCGMGGRSPCQSQSALFFMPGF